MPEFDLDQFKKTWQEQEVKPKYESTEIVSMLNKSSRNYVKYIFWISVLEFLVIVCMNIYYSVSGGESNSFIRNLERLGVQDSDDLQANFGHLYFVLKIISMLLTAFFVVKFYQSYKRIKVESNLKKFILQIMSFKKTVNLFIIMNIGLLISFTLILTAFTFYVLSQQQIHLTHPTLIGFIVGIAVMMALSVLLIWLYYRIVYGIIMLRLGKNMEELKKIEEQE